MENLELTDIKISKPVFFPFLLLLFNDSFFRIYNIFERTIMCAVSTLAFLILPNYVPFPNYQHSFNAAKIFALRL